MTTTSSPRCCFIQKLSFQLASLTNGSMVQWQPKQTFDDGGTAQTDCDCDHEVCDQFSAAETSMFHHLELWMVTFQEFCGVDVWCGAWSMEGELAVGWTGRPQCARIVWCVSFCACLRFWLHADPWPQMHCFSWHPSYLIRNKWPNRGIPFWIPVQPIQKRRRQDIANLLETSSTRKSLQETQKEIHSVCEAASDAAGTAFW